MPKTKESVENTPTSKSLTTAEKPEKNSPEWQEYIMGQLREDEKKDGKPTCDGLRRLVEQEVGLIVTCYIDIPQCPNINNGKYAVAKCSVSLKVDEKLFLSRSDIAEVHQDNCEYEFSRHAAASAATRAESRVYRKLLGLKTISAEEASSGPPVSVGENSQYMTDTQLILIKRLCKENDINLLKFVNSGEKQYPSLKVIPYEKASSMIQQLNAYNNKEAIIKDEIKGYEELE